MIVRNLRHLRIFLSVCDLGSLTLAAAQAHVSQPAVSQSLLHLEVESGGQLFDRKKRLLFPSPRGLLLAARVRRAFQQLDPVLTSLSPRLRLVVTRAQLNAVIATCEAQNFTLAARSLGIAQPSVHRAISLLEREVDQPLFRRAPFGLIATSAAEALAQAARLAFAEFQQAQADLAEFDGREAGRIVIGALPLARSALLPRALSKFRSLRPRYPVKIVDGQYDTLLGELRRGNLDLIIGALRVPSPIDDVTQETLFEDQLMIISGPDHPLRSRKALEPDDLAGHHWIVPRSGTPARDQFDAFFRRAGVAPPESIIETGSILVMREMLNQGNFLGCISGHQARTEMRHGLVAELDVKVDWPGREIGITTRASWLPTVAQKLLLELVREEGIQAGACHGNVDQSIAM